MDSASVCKNPVSGTEFTHGLHMSKRRPAPGRGGQCSVPILHVVLFFFVLHALIRMAFFVFFWEMYGPLV